MWSDYDDEHDRVDHQNEREDYYDHVRSELVRAAHDLVKHGAINEWELKALGQMLRVFDPEPKVDEEPDIKF